MEDNLDVQKELRKKILLAGYNSVNELIKVLNSEIISEESDFDLSDFRYLKDASDDDILKMLRSFVNKEDLSADKMRNAVLAKKQALDDAFYILNKIRQEEEAMLEEEESPNEPKSNARKKTNSSFAEERSR